MLLLKYLNELFSFTILFGNFLHNWDLVSSLPKCIVSCTTTYQHAFKKGLSKLVNFCAAILILKMEEYTQHFGILCFSILRKVKMQLKCKRKRFVQCMEKVLWLIEHVKSGLRNSWYYWHFGQIILCWGTALCIGRCLAALLTSTH